MDATLISYDLIENTQVDTKNLNDFLRMAEDFKFSQLMDEINKESEQD